MKPRRPKITRREQLENKITKLYNQIDQLEEELYDLSKPGFKFGAEKSNK